MEDLQNQRVSMPELWYIFRMIWGNPIFGNTNFGNPHTHTGDSCLIHNLQTAHQEGWHARKSSLAASQHLHHA